MSSPDLLSEVDFPRLTALNGEELVPVLGPDGNPASVPARLLDSSDQIPGNPDVWGNTTRLSPSGQVYQFDVPDAGCFWGTVNADGPDSDLLIKTIDASGNELTLATILDRQDGGLNMSVEVGFIWQRAADIFFGYGASVHPTTGSIYSTTPLVSKAPNTLLSALRLEWATGVSFAPGSFLDVRS